MKIIKNPDHYFKLTVLLTIFMLFSCGKNSELFTDFRCEEIGISGSWSDLMPLGRRIMISENCNVIDSKCNRSYKPVIVTSNQINLRYNLNSSDMHCDIGQDLSCEYSQYGDKLEFCGMELWRE